MALYEKVSTDLNFVEREHEVAKFWDDAHIFEKTEEDNAYLFEGLNISKAGEKYKEYQGQYPVITLSLKSIL